MIVHRASSKYSRERDLAMLEEALDAVDASDAKERRETTTTGQLDQLHCVGWFKGESVQWASSGTTTVAYLTKSLKVQPITLVGEQESRRSSPRSV